MFIPSAAGAVGIGAAGLGAYESWRMNPDASMDEHLGKATAIGLMAGGAGYVGAKAAGYVAFGKGPASMLRRRIAGTPSRYFGGLAKDFGTYSGMARAGTMGYGAAAARMMSHRPGLMMAAGATLGGVVGDQFGEPGMGAVAGAGAGLVAQQAMRYSFRGGEFFAKHMPWLYKDVNKSKFLVKGLKGTRNLAAVGLISAGILATGLMARTTPYESEAEATSDGTGGYEIAPVGAGRRAALIGATGDINFGLHARRRG